MRDRFGRSVPPPDNTARAVISRKVIEFLIADHLSQLGQRFHPHDITFEIVDGKLLSAEGIGTSGHEDQDPLTVQLLPMALEAMATAQRAMIRHPQPNYTITKVAEEAGEVVKAAVHCAEGRGEIDAVAHEICDALAMLFRLYVEGDQVHGLPPISPHFRIPE